MLGIFQSATSVMTFAMRNSDASFCFFNDDSNAKPWAGVPDILLLLLWFRTVLPPLFIFYEVFAVDSDDIGDANRSVE